MSKTNNEVLGEFIACFDGLVVFHFGSQEAENNLVTIQDTLDATFQKAHFVFVRPGMTKSEYDSLIDHAFKHAKPDNMQPLHLGLLTDDASMDEIGCLYNEAALHDIYLTPVYFFDLVEEESIRGKLAYHMIETLQILNNNARRDQARITVIEAMDQLRHSLSGVDKLLGVGVKPETPARSLADQMVSMAEDSSQLIPTPLNPTLAKVPGLAAKLSGYQTCFYMWPQDKDAAAELNVMFADAQVSHDLRTLHACHRNLEIADGIPQLPLVREYRKQFVVVAYSSKETSVKGGDFDQAAHDLLIKAGFEPGDIIHGDVASLSASLAELVKIHSGEEHDEDEAGRSYFKSSRSYYPHDDGSSARNVVNLYNQQNNINEAAQRPMVVNILTHDTVVAKEVAHFLHNLDHCKVDHKLYIEGAMPTEAELKDLNARFWVMNSAMYPNWVQETREGLKKAHVPQKFVRDGNFTEFTKLFNDVNGGESEFEIIELHLMTNHQSDYDKFAAYFDDMKSKGLNEHVKVVLYGPNDKSKYRWIPHPRVCYYFVAEAPDDGWYVSHHLAMLNAGVEMQQGLAGSAAIALEFHERICHMGD